MSAAPDPAATGLAVVSGASTGIGAATATALARAGLHVMAGVRDDAAADLARAQPRRDGLSVEPVRLDVTDPEQVTALRARVEQLVGRGVPLAAVVNNAGAAVTGPVEAVPLAAWRAQFEVNVLGAVAVTQALLPSVIAARGAVVNVSSIAGRFAGPLYGPYASSKHALEAVSDALRREVGRLGVRVVVIEPGAVRTPIWRKGLDAAAERAAWMTPEQHERYDALVAAAERFARVSDERGVPAQEVADVVVRAVRSPRPRTRYPVGREARVLVPLSRVVPDRLFDALVAHRR